MVNMEIWSPNKDFTFRFDMTLPIDLKTFQYRHTSQNVTLCVNNDLEQVKGRGNVVLANNVGHDDGYINYLRGQKKKNHDNFHYHIMIK